MRKQFQSESYTLFINDVRRLQSWKGLHSLPLHAAATHRIHDNRRCRALPVQLLSSFSHVCHSSTSNTRDDPLSSCCCSGLTFHTHTLLFYVKILCEGSCLFSWQYLQLQLSGSQCTRQSWQVFLPVDMCRVGGQDLNVVSSAIPDSRYFAPTTVS